MGHAATVLSFCFHLQVACSQGNDDWAHNAYPASQLAMHCGLLEWNRLEGLQASLPLHEGKRALEEQALRRVYMCTLSARIRLVPTAQPQCFHLPKHRAALRSCYVHRCTDYPTSRIEVSLARLAVGSSLCCAVWGLLTLRLTTDEWLTSGSSTLHPRQQVLTCSSDRYFAHKLSSSISSQSRLARRTVVLRNCLLYTSDAADE